MIEVFGSGPAFFPNTCRVHPYEWVDAQELPEWALSRVSQTQNLPDVDDGIIAAEELDDELAGSGVFGPSVERDVVLVLLQP
jgi:hypothetical protein